VNRHRHSGPAFINEGEKIRAVATEDAYLSRA
jgi:hypothetical protein